MIFGTNLSWLSCLSPQEENVTMTVTADQEEEVLEFCCEVSRMPYNRRTSASLQSVGEFVIKLKQEEGSKDFAMSSKTMFQWWWAFTKKHNIISLYYQHEWETINFDIYESGALGARIQIQIIVWLQLARFRHLNLNLQHYNPNSYSFGMLPSTLYTATDLELNEDFQ